MSEYERTAFFTVNLLDLVGEECGECCRRCPPPFTDQVHLIVPVAFEPVQHQSKKVRLLLKKTA